MICALLLLLPEKNFSDMCYGLVEVVIFSLVIDIVVGGKRSSYHVFPLFGFPASAILISITVILS